MSEAKAASAVKVEKTGASGQVMRKCDRCKKKEKKNFLQRRAVQEGPEMQVPPIVQEVLRSPGQPLDAATREFMEPRFGHDFSRVRVHTDARAAESARAVNALAYTVGRDVVFDEGLHRPQTAVGRSTLAHELTHVVQQRGATQTWNAPLKVGPAGDAYEQEADAAVHRVARGASAGVQHLMTSSSIRLLQRQTRQDTHAGLFELTRHNPLGGPTFIPQAQYDVRIEFLPYDIVNCTQVAMTQTVMMRINGALLSPSAAHQTRALTAAEGTEGVGIDRISGSTSPFYGTANTGVAGPTAHFGSHTPRTAANRAWIEDRPGANGSTPASSRNAGGTEMFRFETCAICAQGTDRDAYYGCVSWGYDISATNAFTEVPFTRVSRGTPSSDFLAAARKWNVQTIPVATADLPIPGYSTRNAHMKRSEILAEISTLETRLAGLAAGHADIPQITFDLRVLRDFRDAIIYNEDQHYLLAEIRMIQQKVGAPQDGIWGYETVRRVKIWQATHGIRADGRVGPVTFGRMGLHRAGDYPMPNMSETATRRA